MIKPFIIGSVAALGVGVALLFSKSAQANSGTSGDLSGKVSQLANAIAFAEGFQDRNGNILQENVPARFHNPGDLGPGDAPGYASESHGGSQIAAFPDDATGWKYLTNKVTNILSGKSSVYTLDMTFLQMASKYAGNSYAWALNVTDYLSVNDTMTLREWVN